MIDALGRDVVSESGRQIPPEHGRKRHRYCCQQIRWEAQNRPLGEQAPPRSCALAWLAAVGAPWYYQRHSRLVRWVVWRTTHDGDTVIAVPRHP
eukprot:scaffold8013_cov139-Amphora_coffeaeformis.AAC.4